MASLTSIYQQKCNSTDLQQIGQQLDDDFEFEMGMMFNGEDEPFNTYNAYAMNKAFEVRRGQKYIHEKKHAPYVPPHEERKVKRMESRNGLWEVIDFNPVQNHPFVPENQTHFIRSHRRGVLDGFKSVGVGTTVSSGFIGNDTGGNENVGCTLHDPHDYFQPERSKILSIGDVQSLVNHFNNLHVKDHMLFHAV
ncbi:hypothetical protein RJ639_018942 [Escallonia herrerae]|uniref:Uncharacterized protein n=1 Tax=Escallonia herrerae TaxID=1293975 RepID=A0AA89AI80_9ASTE|nr:hypothetical protein RJ639_018942 [Escallonia herrerae]